MKRKKIKKSSLILLTLLLVAMSSFTVFAVATINYKIGRPTVIYTIATDSKNVNSQTAVLTTITDTTQGTTDYYLYANGSTKGLITSYMNVNNASSLVWYVNYANHGYANYTGNVEVRVRSICENSFTISGAFNANYR